LFWESFTIYNKKTNIFQFGIILNNGAIVLDGFFQNFGKEIIIFQKKIVIPNARNLCTTI
jgi:hypothetical protein